jgi:hypothetical protein
MTFLGHIFRDIRLKLGEKWLYLDLNSYFFNLFLNLYIDKIIILEIHFIKTI